MLCVHKIPEHSCERITDVEQKLVHELRSMVAEMKEKIGSCDAASSDLEAMLSDLQQQRDNAHDLIRESYISYKALLEKRQVRDVRRKRDGARTYLKTSKWATCSSLSFYCHVYAEVFPSSVFRRSC